MYHNFPRTEKWFSCSCGSIFNTFGLVVGAHWNCELHYIVNVTESTSADGFVFVLQYTKSNISNMPEDTLGELTEHYEGCRCETESCSPVGCCSCISRFGPAFDSSGRLLDIVPYTDLLRPVFECHDDCSCGQSCCNRVVQHGVTIRLQVFSVGDKGVGVRTLEPIVRGSFVCEYSGEVLSEKSARWRTRNSDPAMHNYVLAVREFFGAKLLITYVDATYVGNVGRFINHSCEPNLFVQPVRVENAVPRVALFALGDIPVYTELTYDYSGGGNATAKNDCNLTSDIGEQSVAKRKPCLCGSSHCRLILPYDDTLFISWQHNGFVVEIIRISPHPTSPQKHHT